MRKMKPLALRGNVPELQKDAQLRLRGGFGIVGTKSIDSLIINENCALVISKDPNITFNNRNCDCGCGGGSQ